MKYRYPPNHHSVYYSLVHKGWIVVILILLRTALTHGKLLVSHGYGVCVLACGCQAPAERTVLPNLLILFNPPNNHPTPTITSRPITFVPTCPWFSSSYSLFRPTHLPAHPLQPDQPLSQLIPSIQANPFPSSSLYSDQPLSQLISSNQTNPFPSSSL